MSDNVILAQQTIEGFAEIEEGAGAYFAQREQTLSLTAGETYTVAWDGTEYSCIAVSMDGAMVLGNLSLAGISSLDSGEPFVIGCIPAALTGVADMLMIYTTDAAESHTVAIAVEGIVTFNRYGDKEYHYGIQTLTLDTTTAKHQRVHTKGVKAEKTVSLDMAGGDLIIEPDPGTLLGKVTVQKPETMTPENIRNGVELGGVQGSFIGDTEEITVDLNMADGDQVIVPSAAGKVISKVTVTKPETLVPENIAKDVDIGNVVGTLVVGGSSGSVIEKDVNFYDCDGILLHSYTIAEANAMAALPPLPEREGLICQGWNHLLETVRKTKNPLDIGAIYITDDGKTRVYIEIRAEDGYLLNIGMRQTVSNGVAIDWGDGSAPETVDGTGGLMVGHTYNAGGQYIISFDVADGCELRLGKGGSGDLFPMATARLPIVKKLEIGRNVPDIGAYAFRTCYCLGYVTIPEGVSEIAINSFYKCYRLRYISIPRSVMTIGNYAFGNCEALQLISLPDSLISIGTYCFYTCRALKRICIPETVNAIGEYSFNGCYTLEQVNLTERMTTIEQRIFYYCYSLSTISIPTTITNIGAYAFRDCYGILTYDFSQFTSIPTLGSTAFEKQTGFKIKVPVALLDSWKAAKNWSEFADYIVGV